MNSIHTYIYLYISIYILDQLCHAGGCRLHVAIRDCSVAVRDGRSRRVQLELSRRESDQKVSKGNPYLIINDLVMLQFILFCDIMPNFIAKKGVSKPWTP